MISQAYKSFPISPITGQKLGQPSQDYHQRLSMSDLGKLNNERSTFLKHNHYSIDQEELQNKVNEFLASKLQLEKQSTDQYHDQFCVCTDCVYERKLSKSSHTLFNLTLKTTYKNNFKDNSRKSDKASSSSKLEKTNDGFNVKSITQRQSSIHPKDKVSFQTIYNASMKKETNPEKTTSLKNEDSLKFQGPFQNTTTYKQKFPGISGSNPYVKPVDKAVRQNFSLNSKTTNSKFYTGQMTERPVLARSPDNIRTGLPLLYKQSTSQKFYRASINPQQYNKSYKLIQKRIENPKDINQFGSTYGKSFYGPDVLQMVKHKKRLIRQTMSKLGM